MSFTYRKNAAYDLDYELSKIEVEGFMSQLVDSFGRQHTSLRVSVTDRCNLRCRYCMPACGVDCSPKDEILSFEDLTFTVEAAESMGIEAVRITGGEPLLRRDLPDFVAMLTDEVELDDIAMTTNGFLLPKYADPLAEAGLDRVNISLDSLQPERYLEITRFGEIENVWNGIEAAAEAGFYPIKINALALDGFNDDEFEDWLDLTREHSITVRFMELMPVGQGARMKAEHGEFLDLTKVRRRLVDEYGLEPASTEVGNGPARYWKLPGAPGQMGFITPMSNPYCSTCSRLRLTSTGQIRPCMAFDDNVDIKPAIRKRDRREVQQGLFRAVRDKPRGHKWNSGEVTKTGMSEFGG